jgi:hypothetical protein
LPNFLNCSLFNSSGARTSNAIAGGASAFCTCAWMTDVMSTGTSAAAEQPEPPPVLEHGSAASVISDWRCE